MIGWMLATEAMSAECDPNGEVVRALQAWLAGNRAETRIALDQAVTAFGCSAPAETQTLARFWLLDGAVRAAEGQVEEAQGSFAAARRVDPEVWLPDLGPAVHERWLAAEELPGAGELVVEPHPGPGLVWVDGAPRDATEIGAGLHLVQVAAPEGRAHKAAVVWVDPGISVHVDGTPPPAPLPPPPAPVVTPPPVPVADAPALRPELQLLTGTSVSWGDASSFGGQREPAVKVVVPVELGLGVASEQAFARLQVGGGLLVDGRYLARTAEGEALSRPTRVDVGAAVGLGDEVRVGITGGARWPSRVGGGALFGWSPVPHTIGELRLGGHLTTDDRFEPAGELLVGVRL